MAISLLIHSFFIGMLWVCGKPQLTPRHAQPREWIDVQLVSLSGPPVEAVYEPASGARGSTAEDLPGTPPPDVTEIKRTTPPKNSAKAIARENKLESSVPKRDKQAKLISPALGPSEGAESPIADPGQTALQVGTTEGSGEQTSGFGNNGHGGNGHVEREFGSPDGPGFPRRVMPSYPPLAKRMEKEGSVLLRVTIDERGRPVDVEVVRKAGFGFDEEAVKAVKGSTFVPAKREGKAMTCKALLPIRFVLKGS